MTTLNLTATLPGDQTGVSIATKVDGYTIKWDPQELDEVVEVWQHTSNVRSSATKVATVADTYYDSPTLTVGTTYYVWTRRVSSFGVPGNWDLGETAGRTVTVTGVLTNNIAQNAVSSMITVTNDNVISLGDTAYGTRKEVFRQEIIGTGNPMLITWSAASNSGWANRTDGVESYAKVQANVYIVDNDAGGSDTADTGWVYPTSNQVLNWGADWSNITNAYALDSTYATATSGTSIDDLFFSGFDFSAIGANNRLIDLTVEVTGYATGGTGSKQCYVSLTDDVAAFYSDFDRNDFKSYSTENNITLSGTNTTYSRGGSGDIHGSWYALRDGATLMTGDEPWTTSILQETGFGVAFVAVANNGATFYLDNIRMKAFYSSKQHPLQATFPLFSIRGKNNDDMAVPLPQTSFTRLVTLDEGVSYDLVIEVTRCNVLNTPDFDIIGNITNQVLTITELKR